MYVQIKFMPKTNTKVKKASAEIAEDKNKIEKITSDIFGGKVDKKRVVMLKERLENVKANIDLILKLLDKEHKINGDDFITETLDYLQIESALTDQDMQESVQKDSDVQIIEGVFDGENMVGADGKRYSVPANYASKSKLVEGDILKLTITKNGNFKYKQIGPIERRRVIGTLVQDEHSSQYYALYRNKKWKLLTPSITFFKGNHKDIIVFIIPRNSISKWAAVENIIKEDSKELLEQYYSEGLEELPCEEEEDIVENEFDIIMREFNEGLMLLDSFIRGEV